MQFEDFFEPRCFLVNLNVVEFKVYGESQQTERGVSSEDQPPEYSPLSDTSELRKTLNASCTIHNTSILLLSDSALGEMLLVMTIPHAEWPVIYTLHHSRVSKQVAPHNDAQVIEYQCGAVAPPSIQITRVSVP